MARGRMLDRRFMESKKLANIHRDARLVYASILPFLDRDGRTIAEPLYLKAIVFRHSDFTIEEIAAAVSALAHVGLVHLYADEDNAAIIEYVDFTRFNSPNAKEAKSDLPGPDGEGAMPCREPLMQDAPATPVQSTCNADGERNGTSTLTTTNNGSKPSSLSATRAHEHDTFLEAWNYHRGSLPAARSLDAKRKRGIDALRKEHGTDALTIFTAAVQCVASDDFWVERGYGLDNLLRPGRVLEKAEKHTANQGMTAGDRKLATTAATIARAIGGLDA
jgi:hypothetical protein